MQAENVYEVSRLKEQGYYILQAEPVRVYETLNREAERRQ